MVLSYLKEPDPGTFNFKTRNLTEPKAARATRSASPS